jgi:hypothetical protein
MGFMVREYMNRKCFPISSGTSVPKFHLDKMMMMSVNVLDHQAEFDFYRGSSLKRSVCRHVAPLGHIDSRSTSIYSYSLVLRA